MTIAIISHPDCLLHENSPLHPESPMRVDVIQEALERYPFRTPVAYHQATSADRAQILAVHDEKYVDWIYSVAPKEGLIQLDNDTLMNPSTLNAALLAAGAVVMAVDLVMTEDVQAVFCNVRPPGHHAEADKAMGFCIFNNVAVGVMHALDKYQLNRVAIVDFDVHHGNGTQQIFQDDERVLLCSSFEHPFYPGYDPALDNEHLLNVPLPAGMKGDAFREVVAAAWFDKLRAFAPELIFFSAGFDAHVNDPLANLRLVEADFVWLTLRVAGIAQECCGGRMVSVLEGGYNLDSLAHCVPGHVNAMML